MPAREAPSRSPYILISQPNNRMFHSIIYPEPEGTPTRQEDKPIHPSTTTEPCPSPSHPCGTDRPCAQKGHTQRPPSAHGRPRRSHKRGLHREKVKKRGPSDSWPRRQANHDHGTTRHGRGRGRGAKAAGVHGREEEGWRRGSYMMRSLHTYILTRMHCYRHTDRETHIADKRQAARQEVLHTNLHTHGNRHASTSADGHHVPDSPSPGIL